MEQGASMLSLIICNSFQFWADNSRPKSAVAEAIVAKLESAQSDKKIEIFWPEVQKNLDDWTG